MAPPAAPSPTSPPYLFFWSAGGKLGSFSFLINGSIVRYRPYSNFLFPIWTWLEFSICGLAKIGSNFDNLDQSRASLLFLFLQSTFGSKVLLLLSRSLKYVGNETFSNWVLCTTSSFCGPCGPRSSAVAVCLVSKLSSFCLWFFKLIIVSRWIVIFWRFSILIYIHFKIGS